jgi:carboxylesterase
MIKPQTLPAGEKAVILFHGLSSSPLEVQLLGRGLQRAGYTVYLPHLPGYGDDGRGQARLVTDRGDWLAQALREFDTVRAKHEQVAIGGLCIGATLALNVAAQRPDQVAAFISLSITLWYDGWTLPWYRIFLPLAAYVPFGMRYKFRELSPYGVKDERMRAWIAREMEKTESSVAGASTLSARSLIQAQRLCRETRRILPDITLPTLAIHAMEDDMSSPRNPEYLIRHIRSRLTRYVVLRDSYHMITLDQEKDRVLAETRDFLDRVMGAEAQTDTQKSNVYPITKTR